MVLQARKREIKMPYKDLEILVLVGKSPFFSLIWSKEFGE